MVDHEFGGDAGLNANANETVAGAGAPSLGTGHGGSVSRRSFIQSLGMSAAAGAMAQQLDARGVMTTTPEGFEGGQDNGIRITGPGAGAITLLINGKAETVTVEPGTTLLDALRYHVHLTGSKEICGRGACGGCSVLVEEKLIASCMMLAHDAVGKEITTVEGLASGANGAEGLDPVQESFIRHDALQCGYCTPGFVMASKALLDSNGKPTLDEIQRGLAGNYCRCGCHLNIFNAVLDASGQSVVRDSD